MGQVKRPYGSFSQEMIEGLRASGFLKVEAFLNWLAERDISIDRTLVSHWAAGRSHLPADLLPALAEFTGRPDEVFGPYVRALGCEVVQLPQGVPEGRELLEAAFSVSAAVGRLQDAVEESRHPGSPGGERLTEEECDHVCEHLHECIQRLLGLQEGLARHGKREAVESRKR